MSGAIPQAVQTILSKPNGVSTMVGTWIRHHVA